ncbi:MAG: dihydrofolate reductase family protein, partial [Streptosporangiaceae bacterium]
MRRLYPAPDDAPDLADLYAYPTGPWVRTNMVASVDGAAQLDGRSGGLSGGADKEIFQLLRGLADVILVGAGTARVEGYGAVPAKRAWQAMREAAGQPPAPAIAVVSRRLDLDLGGDLLTGALPDARTMLLTTEAAPKGRRRAAGKAADVIVAGEERVEIGRAVDALV